MGPQAHYLLLVVIPGGLIVQGVYTPWVNRNPVILVTTGPLGPVVNEAPGHYFLEKNRILFKER